MAANEAPNRGRSPDARRRPAASAEGGQPSPTTPRAAGSTAPGSTPARDLPEQFGRYRIKRKLGDGGMGAVYLAVDTQLDREVALKVPHFGTNTDPEILKRFLIEAKSAAKLDHPNLCPVYDVGVLDGVYYLTMRYLKGKLLSDFAGTPQPFRETVKIIAKLAQALEVAHVKNVIHRDLKPANVIMVQGTGPTIMDFGLAKQTQQQDQKLTQSGTMLGTPAYMPPEQLQGTLELMGPASDVYSLGVIFFELLTGRLPYEADAIPDLYGKILYTDAPLPSHLRPDVPPTLSAICARAMAKVPAKRYPSMKALTADLLEYLKATPETEGAGPLVGKAPAADSDIRARILAAATVAPVGETGQIPAVIVVEEHEQEDRSSSKAVRWALIGLLTLIGAAGIFGLGYVLVWKWHSSSENLPGRVVLAENFQQVDLGGRPQGWGAEDFSVRKEGARVFLQVTNDKPVVRYLTLPKQSLSGDFAIDCELWLGGDPERVVPGSHEFHLELSGARGAPLRVRVDHLGQVKLDKVGLVKTEDFNPNADNIRFRLERKEDVYRVFIDDKFTSSRTISTKGTFEEIRIGLTGGAAAIFREGKSEALYARLYSVKVRLHNSQPGDSMPAMNSPMDNKDDPLVLVRRGQDFTRVAAGTLPRGWLNDDSNTRVQNNPDRAGLELASAAGARQDYVLGKVFLPAVKLDAGFWMEAELAIPGNTIVDMVFVEFVIDRDRTSWVQVNGRGEVQVNKDLKLGQKGWKPSGQVNKLTIEHTRDGLLIEMNDVEVGLVSPKDMGNTFSQVRLGLQMNPKVIRPRSPIIRSVRLIPGKAEG